MARFVWNGSAMVDESGTPLVDPSAPYVPVLPQIISDIPEYRSPVDGRLISTRSERRDDLARNNCREWDPADSPTGGKLKNERFATKRGLKVAEEYRDLPLNEAFRRGELPPRKPGAPV